MAEEKKKYRGQQQKVPGGSDSSKDGLKTKQNQNDLSEDESSLLGAGRFKKYIAGGSLILLLLIFAGIYLFFAEEIAETFGWDEDEVEIEIPLVETQVVSREDISQQATIVGQIEPDDSILVLPELAGEVEKLLVEEGDRVEKDELLMVIEDEDHRLQLEEARSAREAARAQLDEARAGARDAEITEAQASLEMARAQKEQAERELERVESQHEDRIVSDQEIEQAELMLKEAESSYNTAREQKEQAEKDLSRLQRLHEEGFVSDQELEQAEVQLEQAESSYEIAKENKEQAERELERAKWFDEAGFISEQDLELAKLQYQNAKEQVKAAEAALDAMEEGARDEQIRALRAQLNQAQVGVRLAERNLDRTRLEAPGSGTVEALDVSKGEIVDTESPVMVLVDTEIMKVTAGLPEIYKNDVSVGQEVKVEVPSVRDKPFEKEVYRVGELPPEGERGYPLEVMLPNDEGYISPGMFSRIEFDVKSRENVTVVARKALLEEDDDKGLYVVKRKDEKNIVEFRPVETGISQDGMIEVTDGLEEGEKIVIKGLGEVGPGDEVRVDN